VITRSSRSFAGAEVAGGLDAAIACGRELSRTLFCAGGAGGHAQALPHAGALYPCHIQGEFAGDACFSAF